MRFKIVLSAIWLIMLSIPVWSQVQAQVKPESQPIPQQESEQSTASGDAIEEVLVIGEQPGPGLWKVSKGDHVLWIMGTLKPLPKKMTWHSQQVENILAQAQEYITPPSVDVHISTMSKIMLVPSLIGIRNNPDGEKLKDIVPADLYARWSVLKKKYLGNNSSVEKWRPIFAANELYEKAIAQTGLSYDTNVMDVLRAVAKKNNVQKAGPGTTTEIEKPGKIVSKFKKMPLDDLECFAKTIERLENDLGSMRARANAWATGDVETLRKLTYVDHIEVCKSAVLSSALAEEHGLQNIPEQKRDYWVAEAEASLAKHESTFSILPITELMNADGYLAVLRAKGYEIQEP